MTISEASSYLCMSSSTYSLSSILDGSIGTMDRSDCLSEIISTLVASPRPGVVTSYIGAKSPLSIILTLTFRPCASSSYEAYSFPVSRCLRVVQSIICLCRPFLLYARPCFESSLPIFLPDAETFLSISSASRLLPVMSSSVEQRPQLYRQVAELLRDGVPLLLDVRYLRLDLGDLVAQLREARRTRFFISARLFLRASICPSATA